MIARAVRIAVTWLLLLPAAAGVARAQPARPAWLPGFPVRAGNTVVLMWTPVPGATGYRLMKKSGEGAFREIYRGAGTGYTDEVPQAATVAYTVHALAGDKESPPSPQALLKGAEPLKPPVVTGALPARGAIVIRWSSPPGTVFSKVYRAERESGPYKLLASVRQDALTDERVETGKSYFYKIAVVDQWGRESGLSLPAMARIDAKDRTGGAGGVVVRKVVPRGAFFGEATRRFDQPGEIGITDGGTVFVVDRRSIQFLDADGNFLRRIDFDRKWSLPGSPALDRDGDFLVPFYAEGLIRKIARDGRLVAEIRYPPLVDEAAPGGTGDNAAARPADAPGDPGPAARKRPNNPNAIAVDGNGHYWIADGVRSQVVKIDGEGRQLAVVGRPPAVFLRRGLAATDLPAVKSIRFNPRDGLLYALLGVGVEIKVIDPGTARVLRTLGGRDAAGARFRAIGGLAFKDDGGFFVLDPLARTVMEFDPGFGYVATYADIVERDRVLLSANLATALAYAGRQKRLFLASTLGNRVYAFDLPD